MSQAAEVLRQLVECVGGPDKYTGFVVVHDNGSLSREHRPPKKSTLSIFFYKGCLVKHGIKEQGPPSSFYARNERGYRRYCVSNSQTGEELYWFDDHMFDPNPIDPEDAGVAGPPKSLDDESTDATADHPASEDSSAINMDDRCSQVPIPLPASPSDDGTDSGGEVRRLRNLAAVAVPTSPINDDEDAEEIDRYIKLPYCRDADEEDDPDYYPDCDSRKRQRSCKKGRSRPYTTRRKGRTSTK